MYKDDTIRAGKRDYTAIRENIAAAVAKKRRISTDNEWENKFNIFIRLFFVLIYIFYIY